jgi:hypothetical protein
MELVIIIHHITVTINNSNNGTTENSHIGHGTHILQKVLMYKYNRFNTGTSIICTMIRNSRIVITLYCLGTCFAAEI